MDRRRRPLGLLIAALAAVAGGGVLAATGERLQALVWTAPGHEVAALTRQSAVCLGDATADRDVLAGRALFHAPQLFGGQAARAGLSCASCHSNGRRNPHFFLAGISHAPGTADVSASFFSVARGNGRFDSKPIPDLALPGKVSRDPVSDELEHFIRGLIVEEFSGAEPSPAALARVAAYVRAIRPCPARDDEPQTMAGQVDLFRDTVRAAAQFADEGDRATAVALLGAARNHLGLIDQRIAPYGHTNLRAALLRTSRRLQAIRDGDPTGEPLLALLDRFERSVAQRLLAAEKRSLYRPKRVERWLGARAL